MSFKMKLVLMKNYNNLNIRYTLIIRSTIMKYN